MKKIALAAAIAAVSASANADYLAIQLVDNEGANKSYLWQFDGAVDGSIAAGTYALPTAITSDISSGTYESYIWDVFAYTFNETGTTTNQVEVFTTNRTGNASTLGTGLELTTAVNGLASFTNSLNIFPVGVDLLSSVEGEPGFYTASAHGSSESFGVGIAGFLASGALNDTLEIWNAAKATGSRPNQRGGIIGTDSAALAANQFTGLNATLTGSDLSVAPVPVPAAVWLMGSAMAGLGFARRRG